MYEILAFEGHFDAFPETKPIHPQTWRLQAYWYLAGCRRLFHVHAGRHSDLTRMPKWPKAEESEFRGRGVILTLELFIDISILSTLATYRKFKRDAGDELRDSNDVSHLVHLAPSDDRPLAADVGDDAVAPTRDGRLRNAGIAGRRSVGRFDEDRGCSVRFAFDPANKRASPLPRDDRRHLLRSLLPSRPSIGVE